MPTPGVTLLTNRRGRLLCRAAALLYAGLQLASCQPSTDKAKAAPPPPVGHYEGSIALAGQPEMRAALDIRHPSPGHYEAELTVPTASALNFVADTILFSGNQLRLVRPARANQVLTLTQEGDFWRGSLALDSAKAETILLKRGAPTASTYRVEEVAQSEGSGWLFFPSDTGTPGAALMLLPTTETAPAAALWADALAREGVIVLVLPATDSVTTAAETTRLQAGLRLLHSTPGADTASIGAWASGARAVAVAQVLAGPDSPRLAFFMAQNADFGPADRAKFRELKQRKLPLLALYSGEASARQSTALRNVLSGSRGATVRTYRAVGPDLLVPGGPYPRFGAGLPGEVIEWLRGATATQ